MPKNVYSGLRFQCRQAICLERFSRPPASNQALSPARAFSLPPEAMRCLVAWEMALRPSGVLGPVLMPPWLRQRPLGSALALQGSPVLREWAPHRGEIGLRKVACIQGKRVTDLSGK